MVSQLMIVFNYWKYGKYLWAKMPMKKKHLLDSSRETTVILITLSQNTTLLYEKERRHLCLLANSYHEKYIPFLNRFVN